MRSPILVSVASITFVLGISVAACSSSGSGGSNSTGLPAGACNWPSSLTATADGGASATVGRYLLQCKAGANVFVECVTGEASCGVTVAGDGGTSSSDCSDQCGANEYAVATGGPGPNPPASPTLPSGCRALSANPGGVVYSCCPCE